MPKRITIAFSDRRSYVEPILREEIKKHPKASVKMSGGPGKWEVRRDVVASDDLTSHRARNLRRS